MRLAVLLTLTLLFSFAAGAQTIVFVPQPSRIPGLNEYRAIVTNDNSGPLTVQGMSVILEGVHQSLRILSPAVLQAQVSQLNKHSKAHWASLIVEVSSWAMTSFQAADIVKIRSPYDKIFPLAGGLMTFGRTLILREDPEIKVPSDSMPPLFTVPANSSVDYAVWVGV